VEEGVVTWSLVGERPRRGHAAVYASLFGDERVAATLWPGELGGPRTRPQAAEILLADIEHWEEEGFGPWVFTEVATGDFVGRGGLHRSDVGGEGGVEVLYAVAADAWGRGYATEMARAAVERAGELGLPDIVGYTLMTNAASRRVLEKAGLRREGVLMHAGQPHWFGRLALG